MNCDPDHLVHAISQLPRNRVYHYIEKKTKTQIEIQDVQLPLGPVRIKRWNPYKQETKESAEVDSLSDSMIRRAANAIRAGVPLNLDRVFGASYNTRSALEALIAHTPEFYYCYPGRIDVGVSSTEIKKGHKHLLWLPDKPHKELFPTEYATEMTISEIPGADAVYEAVSLPDAMTSKEVDLVAMRMHAHIQHALVQISRGFGGRAYIAKNDQGIIIGDKKFAELPGVVTDLAKENLFQPALSAVSKAALIDCIWLRNGKRMPAVLEVEHSTGVTSGLNRMLGFKNDFIEVATRYIIAAPDEDAEKVLSECAKEQFKALDAAYLPYSAVHELLALEQKQRLKNVDYTFLDNFLKRPKQN